MKCNEIPQHPLRFGIDTSLRSVMVDVAFNNRNFSGISVT